MASRQEIAEQIMEGFDPGNVLRSNDDPAETLAGFNTISLDGDCGFTESDIAEYLAYLPDRRVVEAKLIRKYEGPHWLVEPVGDPSDEEDLAAINDPDMRYEVLETVVLGWSPYTHIIRVYDPRDSSESFYYLAKLQPLT